MSQASGSEGREAPYADDGVPRGQADSAPATLEEVGAAARALRAEVGKALFGLDRAMDLVLVSLLAGGHVLLDEVPGTGKTTLAKALARALGLDFARIQFTPDLLPSDVTGLYWFDQRSSTFALRRGPVFRQVLLADEINRAAPRTQSALLEAMAEGQVTIEGDTLPLPDPFLVIATQNPVELEGTFPLPEAQLDRFLMRIRPGYPDAAAEAEILRRHGERDALESVRPLPALADRMPALRAAARSVRVHEDLRDYIVALARATREEEAVTLGASPRGALYLQRAAQARAASEGRGYLLPDDVKALAVPVLAHRIMVDAGWTLRGGTAEELVAQVVERVAVPVE